MTTTNSTGDKATLGNVQVAILREEGPPSRSLWQEALRRIRRDRLTLLALSILLLMTLACVFAPPIVEQELGVSAERTDIVNRYKPPGYKNNILGTDHLGRDQLVRLLYGGRVSLGVAYGASIMSITIGIVVGMLAGYYGGVIDNLVNWLISTLSSIPSIFLLILVSVAFTPSPLVLILLLGLLGWIGTCRLVRGEVLSLKEREFVVAAHAVGASSPRVLIHHLLPNVASLVIVSLTIDAGSLILIEAGLSYLGLGVRPPTPSWGNMLTSARMYFNTGPHLVVWPGIMIAVTVLCFFIAGDGLRDALDPRANQRA
ncbi:MAG: ABC transporter permease [Aggregatilineaceae bacterium]